MTNSLKITLTPKKSITKKAKSADFKAKAKKSTSASKNPKLQQKTNHYVRDGNLELVNLYKKLNFNNTKQLESNPRFQACLTIYEVLEEKKSLSINTNQKVPERDRSFVSELSYGVLRYLPRLNFIINKLLTTKLDSKFAFVQYGLLQAIYQLSFLNKADHAAVYETVELFKKLYNPGIANLVNGCLRNFLRNKDELLAQSLEISLLPKWLDTTLQQRLGNNQELYSLVVEHMHHKPPFWLRINKSKVDIGDYLLSISQKYDFTQHPTYNQAILFNKATNVENIEGFNQGWLSVQDLHAQFAALILTQELTKDKEEYSLAPQIKQLNFNYQPLIIDSCCAPGGKTTHLLDIYPNAYVIASDFDANRLKGVEENLTRLQQSAHLVNADAREIAKWLKPSLEVFNLESSTKADLILLDIPCSGTGVIRRHPDIKWLRKPSDIDNLSNLQYEILEENWQQVKSGGRLLYTSCSILAQENEKVIERFLANNTDVIVCNMDAFIKHNIEANSLVLQTSYGLQLLNSNNSGDGFYYCLLIKK